jgi:serpin B
MPGVQRIAAVLLVIMLVVACGSTAPTGTPRPSTARPTSTAATASAAPASTLTQNPSAKPSASSPPSSAPGDPFLGSVVKTVSDRLRVRSQPRVSDDSAKLDPVLPLGTDLEVIGGPVTASGYRWYQVAPLSFTLANGVDRGWIAMGDHDGTPWIAVADAPINGLETALSHVDRLPADPAEAHRAAAGITAFGVQLYRKLIADPSAKNVVFSPTSIALALGMARAGAKGVTGKQIDDVLHADGWADLGAGLNALDQALTARDGTYQDDEGGTHRLALRIANSGFAQDGWTIERAYLDAVAAAFGAGLRLVDYQADPEAARKTINDWVSRQTERRIPELLQPPNVTSATRFYLVNAMYLKANWVTEFREDGTGPRAFKRTGSSIDVPTMQLDGQQEVPYVRGDGWRATELRYRGRDGSYPLAMDLIMPDDLERFEAGMSAKQLESITTALTKERSHLFDVDEGTLPEDCGTYPYNLRLFMPRFGVGTRTELGSTLKELGMPAAFDPGRADFTGIHVPDAPGDGIYIANVIHQANIDVDEKGTEAAAATAIGMDTGGCTGPGPAKDVTFRLDHPFIFVLRDLETGAVLFMGRVVDPSIKR